MAKRIYSLSGMGALAILLYLLFNPHVVGSNTMVWMVTLFYALMVGSIHGTLAHSLSARQKRSLVVFPVFMGAVFAVLVYLYIYIVLPLIVPGLF